MSKKQVDIKAIFVYLAMVLLLLIIVLPPLLRVVMREDDQEVQETPKITALLCKKQLLVNPTQYNISVNSTYLKDGLSQVVFTYRSTSLTTDPSITSPTNDLEEPLEKKESSQDQQEVEEDIVQKELKALQNIPGIEVNKEKDLTRLILRKETAETFDATSPYRVYFQEMDKQQAYFQSQGYSCQILKN